MNTESDMGPSSAEKDESGSWSRKRLSAWEETENAATAEHADQTRSFDESSDSDGEKTNLPGCVHSQSEPLPDHRTLYDSSRVKDALPNRMIVPSEPLSTVRPASAPERESFVEAGGNMPPYASDTDEYPDDDDYFSDDFLHDHDHEAGRTATNSHMALPDLPDFESSKDRAKGVLLRDASSASLDWHDDNRTIAMHVNEEEEERNNMIESHFKQLTMNPSAPLQQRFKALKDAVAVESSTKHVFHTRRPLNVIIQWKTFQLMMCGLALWYAVYGILAIIRVHVCRFRTYRFTALRHRGPEEWLEESGPGVQSFRLLWNGCKVPVSIGQEELQIRAEGRSLLLEYAQPVAMNGWVLTTSSGDAAQDAVSFRLEGADGEEGEWQQCGSSAWTMSSAGRLSYTDASRALAEGREEEEVLDMRPRYEWQMDTLSTFLSALTWLLVALCGHARKAGIAVVFFSMGHAVVGALYLSAAVHLSIAWEGSLLWWAHGAVNLLVSVYISTAQRLIFEAVSLVGVIILLARVLHTFGGGDAQQRQRRIDDLIFIDPPVAAIIAVLVGMACTVMHRRKQLASLELTKEDRVMYDKVWAECMDKETHEVSCLSHLANKINSKSRTPARQFNTMARRRSSGRPLALLQGAKDLVFGNSSHSLGSSLGSIFSRSQQQLDPEPTHAGVGGRMRSRLDQHSPCTSLDKLFTQATAIDPILRRKAQEWALESNGWFLSKEDKRNVFAFMSRARSVQPGGILQADSNVRKAARAASSGVKFVKWEEAMEHGLIRESVAWAKPKSAERAMEKALQVYDGDVSRLTDLSRQAIYFDSVNDLRQCLRRIAADGDASIHRIRNRYTKDTVANVYAGMRNVVVKLRVWSREAAAFAADTHVCELQLALKSFAELNTEASHARYITFRKASAHHMHSRLKRTRTFIRHFIQRRGSEDQDEMDPHHLGRRDSRAMSMASAYSDMSYALTPRDDDFGSLGSRTFGSFSGRHTSSLRLTGPGSPAAQMAAVRQQASLSWEETPSSPLGAGPHAPSGPLDGAGAGGGAGQHSHWSTVRASHRFSHALLQQRRQQAGAAASSFAPGIDSRWHKVRGTYRAYRAMLNQQREQQPQLPASSGWIKIRATHRVSVALRNGHRHQLVPSQHSGGAESRWNKVRATHRATQALRSKSRPLQAPVGTTVSSMRRQLSRMPDPQPGAGSPGVAGLASPGITKGSPPLSLPLVRRNDGREGGGGGSWDVGGAGAFDVGGAVSPRQHMSMVAEGNEESEEHGGVEDHMEGVKQDVQQVAQQFFTKSAEEEAGKLDAQSRRWHQAMEEASAWSAFHTSTPLVTSTTLWVTQLGCVLLAALLVANVVLSAHEFSSVSTCSKAVYRFVSLDADVAWPSAAPENGESKLSDLRVMLDGCVLEIEEARTERTADDIRLYLPAETAMNGWLLLTAGSYHPAEFRLQGADSHASAGEGLWEDCGSSSSLWLNRRIDASQQGEAAQSLIHYDLRPEWPWLLLPVVPAVRAVGYLAVALCGYLDFPTLTERIWSSVHVVVGLVFAVAAAGFADRGQSQPCMLWGISAAAALCEGMAVHVRMVNKRLLLVTMAFSGVIVMVTILHRDPAAHATLPYHLLPDAAVVVLGCVIIVFRRRVLHVSSQLIDKDRLGYDTLWNSLISHPQGYADLQELHSTIKTLSVAHVPRQYNRRRAHHDLTQQPSLSSPSRTPAATSPMPGLLQQRGSRRSASMLIKQMTTSGSDFQHAVASFFAGSRGGSLRGSRMSLDGSERRATHSVQQLDFDSPVASLDQLFAQAAGLEPVLRRKVQHWALLSKGMFPGKGDGVNAAERLKYKYILYEEALKDAALMARIKWVKLKRTNRAIEKVLRSYSGNVDQLLDICRHCIIFDKVSDLTECLRVIRHDPHVMLLRYKNRLDPAYDARISAGYRDVALNLRIVTPETMHYGFDTHVCEVQLILLQFAQKKSDEGHKLYVKFRNIRAE